MRLFYRHDFDRNIIINLLNCHCNDDVLLIFFLNATKTTLEWCYKHYIANFRVPSSIVDIFITVKYVVLSFQIRALPSGLQSASGGARFERRSYGRGRHGPRRRQARVTVLNARPAGPVCR